MDIACEVEERIWELDAEDLSEDDLNTVDTGKYNTTMP